MKIFSFLVYPVWVFITTGVLWTSPVFADKSSWVGKHENEPKAGQSEIVALAHANEDHEIGFHAFFTDHQRDLAQGYIEKHYRKGKCPPGLAKKNNGCRPPGQAKKWAVGRQLPDDVIFHNLPPRMHEILGPPPPRHRYVRVTEDILLITKGVGIIVDAIEDLDWQLKN